MKVAPMPEMTEWGKAGWVVAALAFLGLILRHVGPWCKQLSDLEATLRAELKQERDQEREAHTKERDEMLARITKLEAVQKRREKIREAERSIERHRFNNLDQCFNALLLLLKASPDKVPEAVAMIEDMRAKQLVAESEEKAIIRAAEIAGEDNHTEVGAK